MTIQIKPCAACGHMLAIRCDEIGDGRTRVTVACPQCGAPEQVYEGASGEMVIAMQAAPLPQDGERTDDGDADHDGGDV